MECCYERLVENGVEECARGSVLLGISREVVYRLGYDAAVIRTAYLSVQVCNVVAVPSCFVPVMDLFTQHGCLSCRVSVYMQRTGKHVCY